nr:solute carrier family 25 member 45 isoform X4 [Macaca fascicularis]XP_045228070.1 solute carrier family 25 member 45 isoform X4 [Macaca fascicularis]XP_045228071.1 solute carrier family 25 member 45 isoform X4 [Macaca fascicularis]XP_045228072.1 solute carrier family 25 member 45 isoform X4 [Macaca fascicularis]
MVKIYRHESLLGFFKGMSFPIASIAVVNSVLFGVYSNTLLLLTATSHQERRAQPPSYMHIFLAGCTGGFLQAYCLAPFDLIKVRLQNQTEPVAQPGSPPPQYQGPVHCAASIFREEGYRGLFRGAWALMLRDTPTMGIYFITYEGLCHQYTPEGQNPSSATVLVAGGFAGIASWVAATPLDVIKSRMQMDGLRRRVYQGVLDCMNPSVALITFRKSPDSFHPPGSSLPTRLRSPGVASWTLNKLCSHCLGLASSARQGDSTIPRAGPTLL